MLNIEREGSSFSELSYQLDLNDVAFYAQRKPVVLTDALIRRIKLGSKILALACGLQRTNALECMAAALQFPNWHALNTALTKASASSGYEARKKYIESLKFSLVVLISTDQEVALSPAQRAAFEEFAARLATQAGCTIDVVLNAVCAGYCGASSWEEVTSWNSFEATRPLYRFEVDGVDKNRGYFDESPACCVLIKELDKVFQGCYTPEHRQRARPWIEAILVRQPEFLEAGLCLAQIQYDEEDLNAAFYTIERYIKKAELLIPKGYRGKVEWGYISNRFYHRMLWLRMTIFHDADWMRKCIATARKQLRLNPTDNLGVRDIYPLMLLEAGEYEKAAVAARFKKEGRYHQALVRAFSRFAVGDQMGFIRDLTNALFELPILRLFLLDDQSNLPDNDRGYRGVEPDMYTFTRYAWPAYTAVPGLRQACTTYLNNPILMQAEAQLRSYWHGFWGKGTEAKGDGEGWRRLKEHLAASIQLQLDV